MTWHLLTNWLTGHWLLGLVVALALLACTPAGWAVLKLVLGTQVGRMALLVALAIGVGSWYGSTRYAAGVHDTQAQAKRETDAANLKASESAREAESARQGVFHSIEVAHAQGEADALAANAGVLGDVAAGRYVLRSSLRCPVVRPAAAPAADPGRADEAGAPAIPAAVVSDLVRLAGDADGVRGDLILCRSVLAAERELTP